MSIAFLGLSACAEQPQDFVSAQTQTKLANAESSPIIDGANAAPPPGFVSFCVQTPEACSNQIIPDKASVTIDDETAAILVAVNDRVNKAILYEADIEHYGVSNRWTLNPQDGYGDCKDYALSKREALKQAGLPDAALRIAIVRTLGNELHAVLTVDSNKGVLVMDSLTSEIRPWSDTNYLWLIRQASDNPLHWVTVAGSANDTTGSILAGGDVAY